MQYNLQYIIINLGIFFTEARPKWQFLPQVPGYIPVYIQAGDTPLEEINPELAEAFHALPAGRSANKHLEAFREEKVDQAPSAEIPDVISRKPFEKKHLEKKTKKVISDIPKPIERRQSAFKLKLLIYVYLQKLINTSCSGMNEKRKFDFHSY